MVSHQNLYKFPPKLHQSKLPTLTFTKMSQTKPLKILFIPLPSPGHIIPMIDIAKLFASHRAHATIILTPFNAGRFESTIARTRSNNHQIKLQIIPFPSTPFLPPNCESTDTLPARSLSETFGLALDQMRVQVDGLVRSDPPDAIVSDLLMPCTANVANELGIPRYVFPGTGCFAMSVELSALLNPVQFGSDEQFVVPGLPDTIYLTPSKLAEATLPGNKTKEFFDRAREADLSTVGMIVNSFSALEPGYADHYERVTGKRVWMVGPVSLCNQDPSDMAERGRGEIPPVTERVIRWLDSKPARSVLYVCFGSLCRLPLAQLKEIAFGLKSSEVPFIWVIREEDEIMTCDEWARDLERSVEGRGMAVKGWAPQVTILSHVAVGGFMTHCGWGSVTEAASAGVPILAWPLFAEQFYNEILVADIAKIGVKVGAERGFVWGKEESIRVVMGREEIKERVIWIMGEEKEAVELRTRAKKLGEKARQAMKFGGSSYTNILMAMQDIRQRSRYNGAADESL